MASLRQFPCLISKSAFKSTVVALLVGGIPGDDLVIFGSVDINGDLVVDYTGTLLTGEISRFGFEDTGTTTDRYDFRFTITGGLLAFKWAGEDFGVVTTSENSSFAGVFTTNFNGLAKGQSGGIDKQEAFKTGRKYHDYNANGEQDPGDEGLSDWTIAAFTDVDSSGTLTAADTLYASAVTDANGDYSF